jgi:apolipoprotein N-acyltransferase
MNAVPARSTDIGRAPLPLAAAVVVAAIGGIVLDRAFPDLGWWPCALLGVALVLVAAQGRRVGGALLVGFVFGAAFYFPHVEWATLFLGPLPWSALATVMALWCAAGTALIALGYRWMPRVWSSVPGRLLFVPAAIAGLWTAREGIASVWPYGGFSWGRVAFSQSDSPFSPLFAWIGVAGVTFAMVFLAALIVAAIQESIVAVRRRAPGERGIPAWTAAAAAIVVAITLLLSAVPSWTALPGTSESGDGTPATIRIGAVQGNTQASYFDPPDNVGDNLIGQVAATEPVYEQDVDVVIWPEGASDVDPLRDPGAAALWDEVSRRADAPLIGGTITARVQPDGTTRYFNTVILWRAGLGQLDFYDKKHPVPFGEYVPDRAIWRTFAPDLIDLIQREYTPGTTDAVVDLGAGDPASEFAGVLAGNAICFDIVDDQLLTEMIEQGAQIVLAETNNADFGRTDESIQQLAIARIRAIETARTVINISTVGTSAVILPDGTIAQQLETYTSAVMVADVPLRTTVTPAVLIGRQLEWLACGLGLSALLISALAARGRRGEESQALFRPGLRASSPRRARR